MSKTDWKGAQRASEPVLLSGNPQRTAEIIDGIQRKHKYTSGSLVFGDGESYSPEQKAEIMQKFEQTFFPGGVANYDILWVEHTDKGRLELNFVIPNTDLLTGQRITPYLDKLDRRLKDLFQTVVSYEYGSVLPDDPSRSQLTSHTQSDTHMPITDERGIAVGTRREIQKNVEQALLALNVSSRTDVIRALEGFGIEVNHKRTNDKQITITSGDGKSLRLKGALYEGTFRGFSSVQDRSSELSKRHREDVGQRIGELRERLEAEIEKRARRISKDLGRSKSAERSPSELMDDISRDLADCRDLTRSRGDDPGNQVGLDDHPIPGSRRRVTMGSVPSSGEQQLSDNAELDDDGVRDQVDRVVAESESRIATTRDTAHSIAETVELRERQGYPAAERNHPADGESRVEVSRLGQWMDKARALIGSVRAALKINTIEW
jgi:hypothetical protein